MAKIHFACLLWLGWACTRPNDKPSYPIVARIMSSQDADYELRDVTIDSLQDLDSMSGDFGTLKGQASLNLDADFNEIMASADPSAIYRDHGRTVHTDYLVKNGVIIPQNFQTMEMLGLYYSYQRTVRFWEQHLDFSFARDSPPSLFYNPQLFSEADGEPMELSTTMNAAYLPSVQDFWFFKTASRERVPVKMNFGVIAHEFSHYIFDAQFAQFDPNIYKAQLHLNEFFLAGLNEGLADYFSFVVTGSVAEFAASLPELDQQRRLPVAWTLSKAYLGSCTGSFYCQGSVLASALYEIAQAVDPSGIPTAQVLLRALPDIRRNWLAHRDQDLVDFSLVLSPILEQAGLDREVYCQSFKKWFDAESIRSKLLCT
ncbi:MAG: hypothetical protein NTX25_13700 [Proteobacteria bacterium]|nr:hypothetical protein [Pseudomonadota bacterium]